MTHYPHRLSRPGAHATGATFPSWGNGRDVLWGRPVFKAPQLPERLPHEPLPFTAARITRHPRTRKTVAA